MKSYDRIDGFAVLEGVDHARLDERRQAFNDVLVGDFEPPRGMRANPWRLDRDDAKRVGVRRKQQPQPERGRRDGGKLVDEARIEGNGVDFGEGQFKAAFFLSISRRMVAVCFFVSSAAFPGMTVAISSTIVRSDFAWASNPSLLARAAAETTAMQRAATFGSSGLSSGSFSTCAILVFLSAVHLDLGVVAHQGKNAGHFEVFVFRPDASDDALKRGAALAAKSDVVGFPFVGVAHERDNSKKK